MLGAGSAQTASRIVFRSRSGIPPLAAALPPPVRTIHSRSKLGRN
ncbi:hypothetical protein SS05631_c37510 [Sinorhizobium sp. CCBAU 05631]|nr:hypothetical protein SS05631_c37510 [Sinorhizobium sp. CCBAU 05631]